MPSVLIIDDDAGIRRVVRNALERSGYDVREAADGADGVVQYRMRASDLVITDVYMPRQDGIETIQQLREEFPQCRILAISGGAMGSAEGPLTDARMLGADASLAKPFSIGDLLQAVEDVLGE